MYLHTFYECEVVAHPSGQLFAVLPVSLNRELCFRVPGPAENIFDEADVRFAECGAGCGFPGAIARFFALWEREKSTIVSVYLWKMDKKM